MATRDALSDDLGRIVAYDLGATDSAEIAGPDEAGEVRARVVAALDAMPDDEFSRFIDRHARDAYFSDRAVAAGYGLKDARAFIDWLSDQHIDI